MTYTVTYKLNGEVHTDSFISERGAVRAIDKIERVSNMELIGHSDTIDLKAYRH